VPGEAVGTLALRVGRGGAELHNRMLVGLPVKRCELELWGFVGCKQKNVEHKNSAVTGDANTSLHEFSLWQQRSSLPHRRVWRHLRLTQSGRKAGVHLQIVVQSGRRLLKSSPARPSSEEQVVDHKP
jgi:hypothetical protein